MFDRDTLTSIPKTYPNYPSSLLRRAPYPNLRISLFTSTPTYIGWREQTWRPTALPAYLASYSSMVASGCLTIFTLPFTTERENPLQDSSSSFPSSCFRSSSKTFSAANTTTATFITAHVGGIKFD